MDTDTLYVGAMEYLFALNMTDINNTDFKTLDCRNHITVIRPIRSGASLYVCGTGARDPTDRQIDATDLTDVPGKECVPIGGGCNTPGNARARCPPDFYDNGTAIWVGPQFLGSFDVGDYVYLFFHEVAEERRACGYEMMATVARVCKADTGSVVQRREWATYLKTRLNCSVHSTRRMHSKETPYRFHEIRSVSWLPEVDGGIFYATFLATPHGNPESAVCSYELAAIDQALNSGHFVDFGTDIVVGTPVLKSQADTGSVVQRREWATYLKTRLNCSVHSTRRMHSKETPYRFHEIRGVSWLPEVDGGIFYATFLATPHNNPESAVCSYELAAIDQALNSGHFVDFGTDIVVGTPVLKSQEPKERPGLCNSSWEDYNSAAFVAVHPLLAPPAGQRRDAFFHQGVVFAGIASMVARLPWGAWIVCYVGTVEGHVIKLAEALTTGGAASNVDKELRLVDSFVATPNETIRKIELSLKHYSLYVFTDEAVRQYKLDPCRERYVKCKPCVKDPFCGWNGTACLPHRSGFQVGRTC
ncbi:hypothetical protein ISCGN_033192 [Ixodes scapularis]